MNTPTKTNITVKIGLQHYSGPNEKPVWKCGKATNGKPEDGD
ncbi:hypothetical protein OH492_10050 [Vibrio chagasii]|nr:hypothetical protein [Vibrio chagasii]